MTTYTTGIATGENSTGENSTKTAVRGSFGDWNVRGRRTAGRRVVRRRGLSLMEVIFSVGVIMIGLLGVAILIPAAGRVAQKGNALDQAARAGQNWVRDFEARGFAQPVNWVLANAAGSPAYANDVDAMGNVTTWAYEKAFCIDPRYAGVNGDSYFPYPATGNPRMRRISLRGASVVGGRMSLEQADDLFSSHDDLLFERPADPTQIPIQIYDQTGGAKRQSEDRVSYLVTMVPKLQGYNRYRDTYTMSVVVIRNRDASFTTASKDPDPDNERLVEVAQFYGAPAGGGDVQVGDVQLRARTGRTATEAAADLKLHRGDWLMLGVMKRVDPNAAANQVPTFRWYRVVHSDEPRLDGSGRWVADVTLHGPDWTPNAALLTYATIVNDVVAVYEKTIHVETSSLWMR